MSKLYSLLIKFSFRKEEEEEEKKRR